MDWFATSESHSRRQHRAHIQPRKSSPYRNVHPASRPSVAFAPSPTPQRARSHTKINFHGKLNSTRRHNYPFMNDDTFVDESVIDENGREPASDDSFFHWDEEATLLSALMDEETKDNEDEQLDMLAESLQVPFTAQGKRKKKEIAETLVGTHNHVKKVFNLLDNNVDVHYGKGIHLFKKASTTIEGTVFAQQGDFREAHEAAESRIEALFAEIKEDFATRDHLWVKLEEQMNEILTPALEKLKDTPAQVERTIAKLEKQSKSLEIGGKEMSTSTRKLFDDFIKTT